MDTFLTTRQRLGGVPFWCSLSSGESDGTRRAIDAVKLAAACGIPGPEKGAREERLPKLSGDPGPVSFQCVDFVVRGKVFPGGALTLEECLAEIPTLEKIIDIFYFGDDFSRMEAYNKTWEKELNTE